MEEDIKILEEIKIMDKWVLGTRERESIENLIKGYREYKNFYHRRLKEWRTRFENQEKHFLNELDEYDEEREKLKKQLENSIPKSKIKAKIQELTNMRDTSITSEAYNILNGEIVVLQELMEDK